MTNEEKEFYSKPFSFSYSSLNKLLFSPSLFYRDYILNKREIRLDKHLLEGRLIHCLIFEPEKLNEKFKITPAKMPSDGVKNILHKLANAVKSNDDSEIDLMSEKLENTILDILKNENLYQSYSKDSMRLAKIQNNENIEYWNFINNPKVDVIDYETLNKCMEQVDIIMENDDIKKLLSKKESDFVLDPIQTFSEKYMECKLKNKAFGLKGIIDFYQIDDDNKTVTICDLKTTSKSISDFPETLNFYNYWLQAAVYSKLVHYSLPEDKKDTYTILYKFAVIDQYNQVYLFSVSQQTLDSWLEKLKKVLDIADYHYQNNNYKLPYPFLIDDIIL